MPKKIELTCEQVAEWLSYDPSTGVFTWLKDPGRRVHAGDEAGSYKMTNTTVGARRYRYLTLQGVSTPAARVAWLLQYGAWPTTPVLFKDENPGNLRFDNLKLAQFPTIKTLADGRRVYKMGKEAQRHYGLQRYYGITGEQYGEMLAAQKGLCAICGRPETAMINGQPKIMHVDHCHATDQVRALLCGSCNGGLGLFKDDPTVLRAAADYIEKYRTSNVVNMPSKESA